MICFVTDQSVGRRCTKKSGNGHEASRLWFVSVGQAGRGTSCQKQSLPHAGRENEVTGRL